MIRVVPLLLVTLFVATSATRAQVQEEKMYNWVDTNFQRAVDATNGTGDKNAGRSAFNDKSYGGSTFATQSYTARTFSGTRSASLKTFETRSFFGIKNPWFGKKVVDTSVNAAASRVARESTQSYATDTFAVRDYEKAGKKDLADQGAQVATTEKPRPYLVAPKTPGVTERFTENLQKELTIDDVRELLNKNR